MDERCDLIRSVRNDRFIYIRNYMPHLIYGQYIEYMFQTPTTRVWKELYDKGGLRPPQTFFWEPKPPEELYDLESDPDEVRNLASAPDHQRMRDELRSALRDHALKIRDAGFLGEAEMHRRAEGTTIYEMAHDEGRYPLSEVMGMAELASNLRPEALGELRKGLRHSDSAVRYWAALGFLMRGEKAFSEGRADLTAALEDSSPSVRVVVAEILGRFGDPGEVSASIAALKTHASPVDNGAYISMMALNAIANLGAKADSLKPYLRDMPLKDPKAPARANSYVERLVNDLAGPLAKPAPKRGALRKQKQPV